jgi:hypothetical protein
MMQSMSNPSPTRITLTQDALHAAASDGLITPVQAHTLWQLWSTPEWQHNAESPAHAAGPGFEFTNVLYYFGGMVAIGAMSLFMTLGFERMGAGGLLVIGLAYLAACLKVADHFQARHLPVPAGILATLAVVLVPLVVWCLQSLLGLWPPGGPVGFAAYHTRIDWRWLTLEFATLIAGAVMLWRYKLPFMVMPLAVTVWYISMDATQALMQKEGFDWQFMRDVSLVFGLATCALAMWVDVRSRRSTDADARQDFSFWLYLYGAIMFWVGLSLCESKSEWGKFAYCMINVGLVFGGAVIGRRVFTVLGALGVAGYLGYLAQRVFQDSLLFPFALTLLGLGFVWMGVWWQRHEPAVHARLRHYAPAFRA